MNEELLTGKEASNKSKKKTKKSGGPISDVKFEDLEGKLLLAKVGSEQSPASETSLDYLQKKLSKEIEKKGVNCIVIVAGHDVEMQIIEKQK
jgi:hypothetical protein